MDRKIKLFEPIETQDPDSGEILPKKRLIAVLAAERRDTQASERYTAEQKIATQAAVFFTRYKSGITAKTIMEHEDKEWRITGIAEIGRKDGLQITAELVE